jgi:UDP-N-acetylmuramate--alanine ligase
VKLPSGRVHLIGIGGAGMSAVARVLLQQGHEVSGSDEKESGFSSALVALGARVYIGHDASNVDGASMVVVSAAIAEDNPELLRARELKLAVMSRGSALAWILEGTSSIVVAGTHGKSTTAAMIVSILHQTGLDPTYLIGAAMRGGGANARRGEGDLAVAEADESDGSFLLLSPHVGVVTNVEADHLDHWKNLEAIEEAFARWFAQVPENGVIVVPAEGRIEGLARDAKAKVVTYGSSGDVTGANVKLEGMGAGFNVVAEGHRTPCSLKVPGAYNVLNALAAIAACLQIGVTVEQSSRALGHFDGIDRRFQLLGHVAGVDVIEDYAHHPTELRSVIAAARGGPWRRVVAVFQPHLYSRTALLARDFGRSFGDADRVVVTSIYGARESPTAGVTAKLIVDAVTAELPGRPVAYLPKRDELLSYLERGARAGDALLMLGAGDIPSVGRDLLARWEGQE